MNGREYEDAAGDGRVRIFAGWQAILAERTQQGIDTLAQLPGVIGLILAGSVGRDEAWPLSDIDIIPIYDDGNAERAARAVEATRIELLDWWTAEGFCASLDVGKLAFTRSEVTHAVATPPRMAVQYLNDPRWFHSMDKAYHGKAAFDPEGWRLHYHSGSPRRDLHRR